MKKIVSLLLILLFLCNTSVYAGTGNIESNNANQLEGYTDINSDKAIVSEVMTFDEMTKQIAKDSNRPLKEVVTQLQGNQQSKVLQSVSSTYRSITVQFQVTYAYRPSLKFYCETSEGGGFWGIKRILNVDMDRSYNYMSSKAFGGTVYTNLEDAGTIYWIVNGDFYDQGTTTVNTGVDIGIQKFATVNFSVSYTTNHFAYANTSGRYRIR